jgi:hypothetical protein
VEGRDCAAKTRIRINGPAHDADRSLQRRPRFSGGLWRGAKFVGGAIDSPEAELKKLLKIT